MRAPPWRRRFIEKDKSLNLIVSLERNVPKCITLLELERKLKLNFTFLYAKYYLYNQKLLYGELSLN